MAEEYIPDDVDPGDLGGYTRVAPGMYHASLESIQENGGKHNDKLVPQFQMLAGTNEAGVGCTHKEQIAMNSKPGNIKRRIALALALELVTVDELKQAKEAGEYIEINWQEGVGRHLCLEISEDKGDDGKTYSSVPYWNFWHLNDPKAKGIPIDQAAIDASSVPDADPFGGPAGGEGEADDEGDEGDDDGDLWG